MKKAMHILAGVALCGTLCGKPTHKLETLPADVQKHVVAIQNAAKSNDWPTAQREYDQINWRALQQPAKVLNEISVALKGDKDARDLRKEIKTKYRLLREADDADLDDNIAEIPISIVVLSVQRFPAVEFGQLELIVLDVQSLPFITTEISSLQYTDQVHIRDYVNAVVVLRVRDEKFFAAMDMWERRYNKQIDYWDENGNRIVPMGGSVLWLERQAVIEAVEKGGDYDKLWDAYNDHLQKAIGRRIHLKKKR